MTTYEADHDDIGMSIGVHEGCVSLELADETTLRVRLSRESAMDVIGAIQEALQEVDQ